MIFKKSFCYFNTAVSVSHYKNKIIALLYNFFQVVLFCNIILLVQSITIMNMNIDYVSIIFYCWSCYHNYVTIFSICTCWKFGGTQQNCSAKCLVCRQCQLAKCAEQTIKNIKLLSFKFNNFSKHTCIYWYFHNR